MDCFHPEYRGIKGKTRNHTKLKEFIPAVDEGLSNYILEQNECSEYILPYYPKESHTYQDKEHDHIENKMKRIIRKKHKRSKTLILRSKSWLSSTDISSDFDDKCWLSKSLTNSFEDAQGERAVIHLSRLSKEADEKKRRNESQKPVRDKSWLSLSEMSLGSDETCWLNNGEKITCRKKKSFKQDRYKSKRIRNWLLDSYLVSDSDEEYWLTRALERHEKRHASNDKKKQRKSKRRVRHSYIDVARWLPAVPRNIAQGKFNYLNKLTFTEQRAMCKQGWLGWDLTSWIKSFDAESNPADIKEHANRELASEHQLLTDIQKDLFPEAQSVTINGCPLRHSENENVDGRSMEFAPRLKPCSTKTLKGKQNLAFNKREIQNTEDTRLGDIPCRLKMDTKMPLNDSRTSLKLRSYLSGPHSQETVDRNSSDCGYSSSALKSSSNKSATSNLVYKRQMYGTSPQLNRRAFSRFTISDSTELSVSTEI